MSVEIAFSPDQQAVLDEIITWYQQGQTQVLRLFGPAGTGKTTLIRHIPDLLAGATVLYGAYAGKAVSVLRAKGCSPANTLHAWCQLRSTNPAQLELDDLLEQIAAARIASDDDQTPVALTARLPQLRRQARRLHFSRSEDSPIAAADLLICDEVSMVGERLGTDLLSYGTKLLVVGDPAQLPPIDGGGFFTGPAARWETVHLSQIHRQALDSPVLAAATWVRQVHPHQVAARGLALEDSPAAGTAELAGADRVLVGFNDTRWRCIAALRAATWSPPGVPEVGDKVICLSNNRDLEIYNGQGFTVTGAGAVRKGLVPLDLIDDAGRSWGFDAYAEAFTGLEAEQELKASGKGWRDEVALLTFGHALTVHKAQGSEWPRVAIIPEYSRQVRAGWNFQPWLYTALTRASEGYDAYPRLEVSA
jgi:exodeoxyribonuclease-5